MQRERGLPRPNSRNKTRMNNQLWRIRELERGALLIELLIGTGIIAAGLFAVFLGLITSNQFLIRSSEQAQATNALASHLEILRATEFSALTTGVTTESVGTLAGGSMTQEISDIETGLKEITLELSWPSGAQTRSVSIVTRVADDGLEAL